MISTDSITVVSYINKKGGTHSPNLCIEVWEILRWCLEQDVVIRVRHIPGKFNILADHFSRMDRPFKTEWALDQLIVNSIFQMLNYPNVDLFATRFNHKLSLYVSPIPDNHVLAVDSLSMNCRVHTCQGNVREIKIFSRSGKFCYVSGKMKFCKNVRKMSGNFTFQPDEAGMFGPEVSFLLNS